MPPTTLFAISGHFVIGVSMLGDRKQPIGMSISYKAESTLSSVSDLIKEAKNNYTGVMDPDNVVIHPGTNDVMYQMKSASITMVKYGETVTNVTEAVIGLCSIPPRIKMIKRSNETARMVNEYLESMAVSKPEKYILIDT